MFNFIKFQFLFTGNRYNGVWFTQIDVEYKRKYQKQLPEKWPLLIEESKEASKKIRIDQPIEGRFIIYPIVQPNASSEEPLENTLKNTSNHQKQEPSSEKSPPKSKPETNLVSNNKNMTNKKLTTPPNASATANQKRPPKLNLPEDTNWFVYITCVHSTVNVCLRILGDTYSSKFDDMVTNMELKYFETDTVPLDRKLTVSNPEVGKLYAAKVEGDWHRVEVTNVHGLEVTCYYIDHGDEDVLKVKDLRQLLPEFLDLAPQAKSVRLAGLEDLAGDQG